MVHKWRLHRYIMTAADIGAVIMGAYDDDCTLRSADGWTRGGWMGVCSGGGGSAYTMTREKERGRARGRPLPGGYASFICSMQSPHMIFTVFVARTLFPHLGQMYLRLWELVEVAAGAPPFAALPPIPLALCQMLERHNSISRISSWAIIQSNSFSS